ncbi:MAG: DUF3786 domain-containing protein [Oscillospiraceae bacterium]|nr:DUF3786 domain-containing protein [Oscillospiraceae bacterium]
MENNKEQVPYGHYLERFAGADPQEMAARTGCQWENGELYVTFLGSRYAVSHPEGVFRGASELPLTTRTFLLRYLLEGKNLTPTGKWLTFRQMPWGEVYAAPYSGRVLKRAAFSLATRLSAFAEAAQKLGFAPVAAGDCGCQAQLLPGYFMRVLLWEGDEEFPPSAQVLYSDNFAQGFTAEDRVVAADILISVLQANL